MPCGVGGVPTGAGLVDGGIDSRAGVREGLAWRGMAGWAPWLGGWGVREAGQGLGGGCKEGLRFRGVGGRGTGPTDGANFARKKECVQKEEKWLFLKDALCTGAGLVDGGP